MPISYSIDHEHGHILEVWTGEIAATDLAAYWRGYLADPQVMALRKTLADLRNCKILFTGKQLFDLVNGIAIPALKGRTWKTAILVEDPGQFGISVQYQAFAESYSRDAIFKNPDDALAWLHS